MTQSDIERWNSKYESRAFTETFVADPLLIDNEAVFAGDGVSLDVACGTGDNALFLAQKGYASVGVDGSIAGLRHCQRKAAALGLEVMTFVADLERFPLPQEYFDVIVSFRYLDRALIPSIQSAVKSGGLLVFKTFNRNFLSEKPAFPPAYCLRHGELRAWFEDWRCADTNDLDGNADSLTYWMGYRP